jgi:hypothetical protein
MWQTAVIKTQRVAAEHKKLVLAVSLKQVSPAQDTTD